MRLKNRTAILALVVTGAILSAFTTHIPGDGSTIIGEPEGVELNYYRYPDNDHPVGVNPFQWPNQPQVKTAEAMEAEVARAEETRDGYRLLQLAYIEYKHLYTCSRISPKSILYKAFEIGKDNLDPYLMYWVTDFEGVALYNFEYLDRRRYHAQWTDSIATLQNEPQILLMLADMNDKAFLQMKELGNRYLRYAHLKNETYGLLPHDVREKASRMKQ